MPTGSGPSWVQGDTQHCSLGTLGHIWAGLQTAFGGGQGGEVGTKRGLEGLCDVEADGSALQTAPDPAWPGHPSCPPVPP